MLIILINRIEKQFVKFQKKKNFDIKIKGRPSTRDKSIIKLLNSPAIMASGIRTKILSSFPDEICKRLKLLQQEKHTRNNSDIINEEIFAIVDKLIEYKCLSEKQHKQIWIKGNLIHTKKR